MKDGSLVQSASVREEAFTILSSLGVPESAWARGIAANGRWPHHPVTCPELSRTLSFNLNYSCPHK
jgi:hypothetical protein